MLLNNGIDKIIEQKHVTPPLHRVLAEYKQKSRDLFLVVVAILRSNSVVDSKLIYTNINNVMIKIHNQRSSSYSKFLGLPLPATLLPKTVRDKCMR